MKLNDAIPGHRRRSSDRCGTARRCPWVVWRGGRCRDGEPSRVCRRKGSTAVSLASTAGIDGVDRDALYYAGLLHAVGAFGNPAYRKGERLSERIARSRSWDVPAQGARICLEISALPGRQRTWCVGKRSAGTAPVTRTHCAGPAFRRPQFSWTGRFGLLRRRSRTTLSRQSIWQPDALQPRNQPHIHDVVSSHGGEAEPVEPPLDELARRRCVDRRLTRAIADRIDTHNGVEGRWQRVARLTDATAETLALHARTKRCARNRMPHLRSG